MANMPTVLKVIYDTLIKPLLPARMVEKMAVLDPKNKESDRQKFLDATGWSADELPSFFGGSGPWPQVHAAEREPAAAAAALAAGLACAQRGGSAIECMQAQVEAAERVSPLAVTKSL